MTDLQFFLALWERMGTEYRKVDENNAFVIYAVDIEDNYYDVNNIIYQFEITTGRLVCEPYLNNDPSKIEEVLANMDTNEQLQYIKYLIDNVLNKI